MHGHGDGRIRASTGSWVPICLVYQRAYIHHDRSLPIHVALVRLSLEVSNKSGEIIVYFVVVTAEGQGLKTLFSSCVYTVITPSMHDFRRNLFCESCSHVPGPNSCPPEASAVLGTCDFTGFAGRRIHYDDSTGDSVAFNQTNEPSWEIIVTRKQESKKTTFGGETTIPYLLADNWFYSSTIYIGLNKNNNH